MKQTRQLSPKQIKDKLKRVGIRQAEVAERAKVTLPAVNQVLNDKTVSKRVLQTAEDLIAERINQLLEEAG